MNAGRSYARLDRLLHHVAFGGLRAQRALAEIEDQLYAARLAGLAPERPVFITALPRAGTTLLLEVLSALPDFATHTYRDMPFLLCPLLWDRISRAFRKPAALSERAHGDGLAVGYDSPEAFEEVLWRVFWKEHYLPERIAPWTAGDRNPDFERFFSDHMRKIAALRGCGRGAARRYLAKNNAHVARLGLLPAIFPDCRILVPLRNPRDHVGSLLRQHARFTEIHAADPFARRYMEWLGHFEFGAALRPIDFAGWRQRARGLDPAGAAFWLSYWIAAYEAVLAGAGANVRLIDYDGLCAQPAPRLDALAAALGLDAASNLQALAARFRPPTAYEDGREPTDEALLRRAQDLHRTLLSQAI